MKWYALNKEYVNYLKKFDNMVPNIEYTGKLKCFLGVIFKSNDIDYFAPLTSYKPKFLTLRNNIDFYKIVGKDNGKIYGAIDINNMIPAPVTEYKEITFNNLTMFRDFSNKREHKNYWKLLQTEASCIDEKYLLSNAEKLYRLVINNPNSPLAMRCCNFPLLEEKCKEWVIAKEEESGSEEDSEETSDDEPEI